MGLSRWGVGVLLVALVLLALVVLVPGFTVDDPGPETAEDAADENEVGDVEMAPDFTLPDLDGEEHRLLDYRGQVVVVNFWTTTCNFCVEQLPVLEAIQAQWPEQVQVLAVNIGEAADDVEDLLDEKDVDVKVLLDDGAVASEYQVRGVPVTAIVDPDGGLQVSVQGMQVKDNLEQMIEPLLD